MEDLQPITDGTLACRYILGAVETFMDAVPGAGIFKGIVEYICFAWKKNWFIKLCYQKLIQLFLHYINRRKLSRNLGEYSPFAGLQILSWNLVSNRFFHC